jgi:hypothetical protein
MADAAARPAQDPQRRGGLEFLEQAADVVADLQVMGAARAVLDHDLDRVADALVPFAR